jgi:hypothetical protein
MLRVRDEVLLLPNICSTYTLAMILFIFFATFVQSENQQDIMDTDFKPTTKATMPHARKSTATTK